MRDASLGCLSWFQGAWALRAGELRLCALILLSQTSLWLTSFSLLSFRKILVVHVVHYSALKEPFLLRGQCWHHYSLTNGLVGLINGPFRLHVWNLQILRSSGWWSSRPAHVWVVTSGRPQRWPVNLAVLSTQTWPTVQTSSSFTF